MISMEMKEGKKHPVRIAVVCVKHPVGIAVVCVR